MNSRFVSNITGLVLSVGCVIHCMLMPVFIASLPSWGLSWLASPIFHQSLALVGISLGVYTLIPGWKIHRKASVLVWGGCGLLIMNYAAFFEESCCSIPVEKNSQVNIACSDESCSLNHKIEDADLHYAQIHQSGFNFPYWNWLLKHPTIFGASLLAWAHCLNGGCTRKCCKENQHCTDS